MVDDEIGQQYLTQYDSFDLSEKAQRRMAVYAIKEFYATVMADVGREYLHIDEEVKRSALDGQWSQVMGRLESLDAVVPPEDTEKVIYGFKEYRIKTHHNTDFNPPKKQLEEARELAPDWRSWLLENSREYHEVREELDPRGMIVEMTRSAIIEITTGRDIEHAQSQLEDVKEEAEALKKRLEDVETEGGSDITLELIYLLRDALDLRQDMDEVWETEAAVDQHISMRVDEAIEEAAFNRHMKDD
ncbi:MULTISPECIES: hypothetical protein [unclassified Natrinema]|uniref:hypothetical protein n=1 Tax=unclassified Natrinema TaxID=2622230 RepID=UPI0011AE5BC1|nr:MULTISPECIES: hypothetical protein [unclassified Natrinema]